MGWQEAAALELESHQRMAAAEAGRAQTGRQVQREREKERRKEAEAREHAELLKKELKQKEKALQDVKRIAVTHEAAVLKKLKAVEEEINKLENALHDEMLQMDNDPDQDSAQHEIKIQILEQQKQDMKRKAASILSELASLRESASEQVSLLEKELSATAHLMEDAEHELQQVKREAREHQKALEVMMKKAVEDAFEAQLLADGRRHTLLSEISAMKRDSEVLPVCLPACLPASLPACLLLSFSLSALVFQPWSP